MEKRHFNCIQIQVGSNIYQFNGVDTESTSLKDIISAISNNPNNRNRLKGLLNSIKDSKNVKDLIDSRSYSDIAEDAIGNSNLRSLLSLIRTYKDPLLEQNFMSAMSGLDYNDNNILVTDKDNPVTVYCGQSRDFIVMGKNILQSPLQLFNAISYIRVSKELNNKNSAITRILEEGIKKIRDQVPELLELNADSNETLNKLVLAKLPELAKNPLVKENILEPLAEVLKEPKESSAKYDTSKQVSKLLDYANSTTVINGNNYSNGFIIRVLDRIAKSPEYPNKYDGDKVLDSKMNKYLESLDESSLDYRLLNDIVHNEDPDFINQIFNNEGNYRSNLLDYLYKPVEVESTNDITNSRFYPLVEKVNIDSDFAAKDSRIGVSSFNSMFNSNTFKKPSESFQLVIDTKLSNFSKVDNSAPTVKILINPTKEYTPEDLVRIKKAIAKTKNKQLIPQGKTLYVLNQKDNYSSNQGFSKLVQLLQDLRTDGNFVSHVYTAGTQDFALDVAKAAHQNGIATIVYPEYYGKIRAYGDIYSYLDEKLNLNYMSNVEEVTTISELNDIIEDRQKVVKSTKQHKIGDSVTIKSGKESTNKTVKNLIRLNKPKRLIDTIDPHTNDYKIGSVVMITNNKNKVIEGVLIGKDDKGRYMIYNKSDHDIQYHESINPIYAIEARLIGENYYIPAYTDNMYIVSKDGIINTSKNVNDFITYYENELREIYENSNTRQTFEEFIADKYTKLSDFANTSVLILRPFVKENLNPAKMLPEGYTQKGAIELITSVLRRSGLDVRIYNTDYIKENFGEESSNHKAFIHNGGIILNEDKYTEDSPMHELMHLLLGQLKISNPIKYKELLRQVPQTQEYSDLKQLYSELTTDDYAEEVLVHVLTDYMMGKLYDKNKNLSNIETIDLQDLAKDLLQYKSSFRYSSNKDFLDQTLSTLLIDSDSQLLKDLIGGVNRSDVILNNQVSNFKSKLLKSGELKQECK